MIDNRFEYEASFGRLLKIFALVLVVYWSVTRAAMIGRVTGMQQYQYIAREYGIEYADLVVDQLQASLEVGD